MTRFLFMDVDGTLTDGKVYVGRNGEEFKVFDIKDGYAIKNLLPAYDIIPVVITARISDSVAIRCAELSITEVYQGVTDKMQCLVDVLGKYSKEGYQCPLSDIAYIGDDLIDLQCILPIKDAGGVCGCPADAARPLRAVCNYVSSYSGGNGAVRDFIEYLISHCR